MILRLAGTAFLLRNALEPLFQAGSAQQILLPLALGGIACLIAAGFWTPVVSAAATLYEIWFGYSHPAAIWLASMSVAVTSALALLGPGAYSVDALIYGRRRLSAHE